jgi:hypothetical protein
MRRTWPLWAVTAGLSIVGPAAAGASAAGAPPPQRLGDIPASSDLDLRIPAAIGTGPDGLTTALVPNRGRVVVRRARAGRGFGAARRVPLGGNASTPTVAAGDGFAALAWTHFDASLIPEPYAREDPCCRRVRAALIGRSGRITHPRTLSAPRVNVYGIWTATRGRRAVLAWNDSRGLRTSTGVRGVGFRRPATISSQRQGLIGVALPRATPHVFFVTGIRKPRIVEAWRTGGHVRRRTVGAYPEHFFDPAAAVSSAGHLLLASDTFTRSRQRRLIIVTRRPGGRLRTVRVRLRRNPEARTTVALASSGEGLVVSTERRERLVLRSVDRSGHVSRARAMAIGRATVETAAAIARSGAGVLAATLLGGDSNRRRDRVVAWPLLRAGRLGPRHTLYPPGGYASGPLGVTADGRVTWQQRRGTYAGLVR